MGALPVVLSSAVFGANSTRRVHLDVQISRWDGSVKVTGKLEFTERKERERIMTFTCFPLGVIFLDFSSFPIASLYVCFVDFQGLKVGLLKEKNTRQVENVHFTINVVTQDNQIVAKMANNKNENILLVIFPTVPLAIWIELQTN